MPPIELLQPLTQLGLSGVVIALLLWWGIKKDNVAEKLHELRVQDAKERAQDNLKSAHVIEQLNMAAKAREENQEARLKVMEVIGEAVKTTVKAVEKNNDHMERLQSTINDIKYKVQAG